MHKKPYVKLKEILENTIQSGYSPLPVCEETGRWVLGLGALTKKGLNLSEKKPVALDDLKFESRLLQEEDFLVSRSNTREKVGLSSLYKGGLSNCIYPDLMMRFRINKALSSTDYIDHYLRSPIAQNYFASRAAGSNISMVKITKSILEELPIYNPHLQEQKAIATILSTWDEAIEKTERLIELKKQRKIALLHLFNSMIKSGSIPLSRVASVSTGQSAPQNAEDFSSNGIPFLRVSSLNRLINGEREHIEYLSKEVAEKYKMKLFPPNTLIFAKSGMSVKLDRVYMLKKASYLVSHLAAVIPSNKVNPYYLKFWFEINPVSYLLQGDGFPSIRTSEIASISIKLPSLQLQVKAGEILRIIEKDLEIASKYLNLLKNQKQALMQKLLTGKWRVNFKEEK